MYKLAKIVFPLVALALFSAPAGAKTPIKGKMEATVEQMCRFVQQHNSSFDCRIARAFYKVGKKYGLRGDIAFCQSIIETGWFRFEGGTAVTAGQHNYCGLGVTGRGMKGCLLQSIDQCVTALTHHQYAYSCKNDLPRREKTIDPRFKYVRRGAAATWEELGGTWAASEDYGEAILRLFRQMLESN